jgi:hypothetical protein
VLEEERAAVRGMLCKLAESAPSAAGVGRAPAVAWAGLRLAAMVLLAAGVGIGLGDGDEFDDVGCSVAQKPGGTSHGAHSTKTRERPGDKPAGSQGGAAGAAGDGEPYGGKAEEGLQTTDSRTTEQNIEHRTSNIQHRTLNVERGEGGTRLRLASARQARLRVASARQEAETLPSEVAETSRAEESGDAEEPNLSLAAKVFELLTALDPDSRLRKAPPIKVFLLRFRQNLSRAEIARICRCDKSLVGVRLKSIQDKLPWRPQQLRELSAHVEAMQDAVSDSRARRIYRKGAAYGDEDDGGEAS